MDNSIRKDVTKGNVTVDSITVGKFQKQGTETAMLRQNVLTKSFYPSAIHTSDKQENPYGSNDFGDTESEFTSEENRVAFIDVPEGASVADVQSKIGSNACLYRVLSNHPILTDNHENAISRGLTSLDAIADSQVVRYGENDDNAGDLILDSAGRVQYRKIFYWNSGKSDEDLRGKSEYPEYISAIIGAEKGVDTETGEIVEVVEEAKVLEDQRQSTM